MQRREPFKFMLQMAIFGSGLMFLGLLLTYLGIERPNAGFGKLILPPIFWVSTLLMLISSLTLHLANLNFKEDNFFNYRIYTGITLVLGLLFVVMQLVGWQQLLSLNVNNNLRTARGFVYILSGLHILHLLVGLFFLIKIFLEAIKRIPYIDSFVYSVNPPNQLKINLIVFYWHFVDLLWIMLFLFLLWQN